MVDYDNDPLTFGDDAVLYDAPYLSQVPSSVERISYAAHGEDAMIDETTRTDADGLPPLFVPWWWQQIMFAWMDWITGPNFAIVVAFLVILVIQFQGPIQRSLSRPLPQIIYLYTTSFIQAAWWTSYDYARNLWHRVNEFVQQTWTLVVIPLVAVATNNPVPLGGGGDRRRQRRRLQRSNHRCHTMPDLEDMSSEATYNPPLAGSGSERVAQIDASTDTTSSVLIAQEQNRKVGARRMMPSTPSALSRPRKGAVKRRWNHSALEPTFLSTNDYPPDWMVYHPSLGVVSKSDADQHDADAKRQFSSIGKQQPQDEDDHVRSIRGLAQKDQQQQQINSNIISNGIRHSGIPETRVSVSSTTTTTTVTLAAAASPNHAKQKHAQQKHASIPVLQSIVAGG